MFLQPLLYLPKIIAPPSLYQLDWVTKVKSRGIPGTAVTLPSRVYILRNELHA